MKALSLICFLILAIAGFAQVKTDTTFYDRDGETLDTRSGSYYYGLYETVKGKESFNYRYTSNNQLRRETPSQFAFESFVETWFYQNGAVLAKGIFRNGKGAGKVLMWYDNGNSLAELEFAPLQNITEPNFIIIQYWDSLGNHLVVDGEGTGDFKFPELLDNGIGTVSKGYKNGPWVGTIGKDNYKEVYKDGDLLQGELTSDGRTYTYSKLVTLPTYEGGDEGIVKYLKKNIRYPLAASKDRAEGMVLVEFIVEPDGSTSHLVIIKGVHDSCDKEAKRVISQMKAWTPATHRGKPVPIKVVQPVRFTL